MPENPPDGNVKKTTLLKSPKCHKKTLRRRERRTRRLESPFTPEEFVTRWPLYTPAPVEGFHPPTRVSYHCDSLHTCRKETTWLRVNDPQYVDLPGSDGAFKWVWYICGLCNKKYLVIMYREIEHEDRPVQRWLSAPRPVGQSTMRVLTKIQKIGQSPAQSIDIPRGLEKNLGEEAISLCKKGLINRNSGYGLGAVTYIRRVVEDKTIELIEVAARLAESHNVEAGIVERIRAAATERTTYDQKLMIAATVLPDALLIEGVNPLAELYSLVSEGVHALTEEECVAVADETASVFEFIFTNLRATTVARHGFVEKVKKWAGRSTAQGEG
jgi:hypothetical protein